MIDATSNPGYVNTSYLAKIAELSRQIKNRTYEVMQVETGHHVIDIGCGPGSDTLPLAKLTGPTGSVVGFDYDLAMVQEAERLAKQAQVQDYVHHFSTPIPPIPYPDGAFLSARSERVFQHISDPQPLLNEMRRVTRPGGWVVVVDTDHSSISADILDDSLVDIEWGLRRARVEMFNNGFSGRKLYRQFIIAGFRDVTVELFPITVTSNVEGRYATAADKVEKYAIAKGIVTEEEVRRLQGAQEKADQEGISFGYGVILLVAGKVP